MMKMRKSKKTRSFISKDRVLITNKQGICLMCIGHLNDDNTIPRSPRPYTVNDLKKKELLYAMYKKPLEGIE